METHSKWIFWIPIIAIIEIFKGSTGVFILITAEIANLFITLRIIIIMVCICKVILGIGLYLKKEWARKGVIGLMIFLVLSALAMLFTQNWGMFISGLFTAGCLIACFYIYYFNRQDIRSFFQNERNKI